MERGIGSGLAWFGDGSPPVRSWIEEGIQWYPWIDSGSPRGANGEHPRIVYPREIVSSPRRYGRIEPSDLNGSDSLIGMEVSQGELDNHVAWSSVDPFDPSIEPAEPVSTPVIRACARGNLR